MWVFPRTHWDSPEQPPRAQGEALASQTDGRWSYRSDLPSVGAREPQNTWTNLAYVFTGSVLVLSGSSTAARMLGVAMCFLGCGSGLYHASATDQWRLIDVVGMYWTMFLLLALSVHAVTLNKVWCGAAVTLVASISGIVAAIFRNEVRIFGLKPFDSTYVTIASIGAVAVGLFIVSLRHREKAFWWRVAACLASALLAVAARLGDEPGRFWFDPDAVVQGHAVWHVAGSAAILLAVDAFRRARTLTLDAN